MPMSGGKRESEDVPEKVTSWLGEEWHPGDEKTAAHPNARYTTPAAQCPIIDPNWENPNGVPISAILFGGRRATTVPLAFEAFDWQHGTFIGSIASSERTAAAAGTVGELRRDPMAMLPFCGYNMGDYFTHWLEMGKKHQCQQTPENFLRQLVPQGCRRRMALARLRRKQPSPQVDCGTRLWQRRGS